MTKVKYNITTSKSNDGEKHLYISYETDDSKQVALCTEYIEDFANDFEERFINPPVTPEENAGH